jgi:HlyD family secretion protein
VQARAEQPQPPEPPPVANKIFRQEVLDRLSSPEQLNLLMRVTDGKGWLALLACGLILATALVWGVFGRVPTKVTGSGILLPMGGLAGLVAVADGQLTTLEVKPGDQVTRGQVVARLAQPDLVNQIDGLRKQLRELQHDLEKTQEMGTVGADLRNQTVAREKSRLVAGIAASRARRAELEERLANERMLQKRGILPKGEVQATRQELRAAEAGERAMRADLKRVALDRFSAERALETEAQSSRQRITEMEQQIKVMQERLAASSTVTSPHAGRVVDLRATVGEVVRAGQAVASLQRTEGDEELEALLYVDSREGKNIKPGMSVEVAPTIVKRERHGAILAVVHSVDDFPSTRNGMIQVLQNEELVDTLRAENAGAPVAVRARLRWDPASPSGYRWTSGKGPDLQLSSGTRFAASIVTRSQRPLGLVFPLLDRGI